MVKQVSIGVLGIQGAISEHVSIMKQVFSSYNLIEDVPVIRRKEDLENIQGLIIPGGESTTISRFLLRKGLSDVIKERVENGSLSVMGTCAGCVLVAKNMIEKDKDITLLGLLDIEVRRNAFGRQRESFEQKISIKDISSDFPAVFIRAPIITKTGSGCTELARVEEGVVMVKQDNVLALSFHPELTHDKRIHDFFFNMVQKTVKEI